MNSLNGLFRYLLVPLDGSRLAEAVLPATIRLAQASRASVTLLHVIERDAPSSIHGERHLCDPEEAWAYLDEIKVRLAAEGIQVDCHVHEVAEGNVARSIVEHSEELGNDLIMLSTHGRSGVRSLLVGSIAQQVLGTGSRPVFVVHPDSTTDPFTCRRIAVPLDMEKAHERSLPIALALAGSLRATLYLVTVVPRRTDLAGSQGTAGRFFPLATSAGLDITEEAAQRYLQEKADRLGASEHPDLGLRWHVLRGDPVASLVSFFEKENVDLAVMASHATRGWRAFWEGSVTPRVLTQWRRPVLLVRA